MPDEYTEIIAELEAKYPVTDEEAFFRNLVNPSLSKKQPYYGWARYREAYSGELVKELIRRSGLNPGQHFVYDPMSGSGSTLLGAVELGFDSIGNDVNPYAVDVTNAKLYQYTDTNLRAVEDFIASPGRPPELRSQQYFCKNLGNCGHYFREENVRQLEEIIDQIARVEDALARELLKAVWLTILEDCSERKKDGNGLATRPTKVTDVWRHFCSATENVLRDIRTYPLPQGPHARAVHDTSFNAANILETFTKDRGKRLGAIIFSPPYANSFDYFESYKLELLCGYYSQKQLAEARKMLIRSYRKGYGYNLTTKNNFIRVICEEVEKRIPIKEKKTGVIDNRSRLVPNLLIGYFEDMGKTLEEFSKAMPKGSYCYIVVDQSAYLGVIVPSDLLLAEIGAEHGLLVEGLIRCRTAKTSAQQLKEYPYLRTALRESIVVLKKA